MASKLDYLRRNFGADHILTLAAEAGDVATFRRNAALAPANDPTVAAILDAVQ